MSRRTLGVGLVLVGVLIAAASLFADALGVGAQPGVLGWKQILGTAVGAAICAAGLLVALRRRPSPGKASASGFDPGEVAPAGGHFAPSRNQVGAFVNRGRLKPTTPARVLIAAMRRAASAIPRMSEYLRSWV